MSQSRPPRRREDERLLRGQGVFTDDLNLPGQAYAAFRPLAHAHGGVAMPGFAMPTSVDAPAARSRAIACGTSASQLCWWSPKSGRWPRTCPSWWCSTSTLCPAVVDTAAWCSRACP